MRAAIFGGTFNPPHLGHLILADAVRAELFYDRIFFVPAFIPPHKKLASGADVNDRVAMLKKAIAGQPAFKLELCEIRRGGVSYTIDTVSYLEKKLRAAGDPLEGKIGVILGDDLAKDFHLWKNAALLAQRADLILARRTGLELQKNALAFPHVEVPNTYVPLSSSEIRTRILQKKSFRYLVPNAVYRYITDRKLYEY